ncbi:MAG TPA: FMN-binding protein [Bryobacteraceae bacterium]|nr:FMN-binding protein [Bryobacteraceae bacterium]
MAQGGSSRKVANSLLAAGAAAVLAVYAAGYERTRPAAEQLEAQSAVRRPAPRAAKVVAPPAAPAAQAPQPAEAPREVAVLAQPSEPVPLVAAPAPPKPKINVTPAASAPEAPAPQSVVPTPAPAPAPIVTASAPAAIIAPALAPAAAPAIPAAPEPAVKYKDGTYKGWGTCRHGDIEAQVVIEGGRITSASISQCLTRYTCDIIGRLPPEVIQRQSAEVDYVTGATESANAFYYAVLGALGKAK